MCVRSHRCVCMYVLEGEPALLAFTSTAIEHLCLALLLVATVTKAKSGVAAAAKERARGKSRERERERFIFLPVDLITTTDLTQRIRKHQFRYSDEPNVNTTERCILILLVHSLSHTCTRTHITGLINACSVAGCSTGHGSSLSITALTASVTLGLVSRACTASDGLPRPFVFMSACFLVVSKRSSAWIGIVLFILSLFSKMRVY